MFRSPHLKFWSLFLLSFIFLFIVIFEYFDSTQQEKKKNIMSMFLILYTIFFWYYWLIGKAIPSIKLVEEIPSSYIESSEYIRASGTQKAILAPFNLSTWTNTDFWYEWYSLFYVLLPDIWIWNRNDGAFSQHSWKIISDVWRKLRSNSWALTESLAEFNIDTIIYDGYTDRYPRFRVEETHQDNLSYLEDSWMILEKIYWKISIWRTPTELLTPNIYSISGNLSSVNKINPTKYSLSFDWNIRTTDSLVFLQSYHPEWKIYDSLDTTSNNSWFNRMKDIIYLFETPLYEKSHSIEKWYANSWKIDGSNSWSLVMIYKPQLYFYLYLLISIIFAVLIIILSTIYILLKNK